MNIDKEEFSLVLLAAGRGTRMGAEINKNFLTVADKPIMYYSLKAFAGMANRLILVIGDKDREQALSIARGMDFDSIETISGGKERYDSVINGLRLVKTKYVFIHDCARCLITKDIIARCKSAVMENNAVIAAMPVKDTIKISDESAGEIPGNVRDMRNDVSGVPLKDTVGLTLESTGEALENTPSMENTVCNDLGLPAIENTPDRSRLWQAQTPQCFNTDLIKNAYNLARGKNIISTVTDDAMAVERAGERVYLVKGDYTNIKITEPGDLLFAEAILKDRL